MATPYAFGNPRLSTATLTSSTFFRPVKTELLHQPSSVTAESCASRASWWNSWQSMEQQVPRCSSSSSDTAGAKASRTTAAGQVQRLVLSNQGRSKLNPASDRGFYSSPRLVTHVDDHFLANLSALYRARIPENAEVLDLMSSWISHLPGKDQYHVSMTIFPTESKVFCEGVFVLIWNFHGCLASKQKRENTSA